MCYLRLPTRRRVLSHVCILQGTSPADLIRKLLELIEYEDHLKKTQPDWESRWENVQELITFASDVESDLNMRQQALSAEHGDIEPSESR